MTFAHGATPFKEIHEEERNKTQEDLTLTVESWFSPEAARDCLYAKIAHNVSNSDDWKSFLLQAQQYNPDQGCLVVHNQEEFAIYRVNPILIGSALLLVQREFSHPRIEYVAASLVHRKEELERLILSVFPWYAGWKTEWLRRARN